MHEQERSTRKLTRKKRGLCSSCNSPRREGKTLCAECARKRRDKVIQKRDSGMCMKISCKNRAVPKETMCAECKDKRSARIKSKRMDRIVTGLCAECGAEKKAETRLCERCKAKYRKTQGQTSRERALERDNGMCVLCSEKKSLVMLYIDQDKTHRALGNTVTVCRKCRSAIRWLSTQAASKRAAPLIMHSGTRSRGSTIKRKGWVKTRDAVLLRDGYRCAVCDASKRHALTMHHKDDADLLSPEPNNRRGNLVTLCKSCQKAIVHLRDNADRVKAASLLLATAKYAFSPIVGKPPSGDYE